MKLDLKFEFVISDFGKEAYVYIIDQNNKDNKKCDVREKTQKISSLLFNFIISHDLDFFFFIDEINVETKFKLFLYIFCNKEVHKKLKKEIFEKEQIKEVNYTINNNSIQLQERIINYPSHFLKINLSSSPKRI